MPDNIPPSWEPEPEKMGNWRAMFEPNRGSKPADAPPSSRSEMPREPTPDEEAPGLDLSVYRPWILQRGRSHPAMMLEFRRFEPRSGLWVGWAIAYPHLVTLEYTGDKMLSLDFGTRQVIVEGRGLDELARYIQQGAVVTIQEYAAQLWPQPSAVGGSVSAIRKVEPSIP